jgi:hypothetical protein
MVEVVVVIYAIGGHKGTGGAWYQSDAYTMQKLRRIFTFLPFSNLDNDDPESKGASVLRSSRLYILLGRVCSKLDLQVAGTHKLFPRMASDTLTLRHTSPLCPCP